MTISFHCSALIYFCIILQLCCDYSCELYLDSDTDYRSVDVSLCDVF